MRYCKILLPFPSTIKFLPRALNWLFWFLPNLAQGNHLWSQSCVTISIYFVNIFLLKRTTPPAPFSSMWRHTCIHERWSCDLSFLFFALQAQDLMLLPYSYTCKYSKWAHFSSALSVPGPVSGTSERAVNITDVNPALKGFMLPLPPAGSLSSAELPSYQGNSTFGWVRSSDKCVVSYTVLQTKPFILGWSICSKIWIIYLECVRLNALWYLFGFLW